MTSLPQPQIVNFGSHNTRQNLPSIVARKRGESNFLRRFEKTYLAAERVQATGREFALEGFGRADLVWIAWSQKKDTRDFTALEMRKLLKVTAIEGKISDWRKGLQQAFRYRYFAHRAILVLPEQIAKSASTFITTFQRLHVGLWSFNAGTGKLRKLFTPRAAVPLNRDAWEKAVTLIGSRLQFGQRAKCC